MMERPVLFISDVHGKWDALNFLLEKNKDISIIQLGDLGIGFADYPYPKEFTSNFKFIRGNHDNPKVCRSHPNYLGDYGMMNNIFFISGAFSIDHSLRTEGINWWKEEQLSYNELQNMIDLYIRLKPKYVISHDCPTEVCMGMYGNNKFPNRTQQALQVCFEEHQPIKWIFGHHHKNFNQTQRKTEFICTKELESYLLD